MIGGIGPIASWLAEVYLLATVVLLATALTTRAMRQPARRLVVVRSSLAGLLLLPPLVAAGPLARGLIGADPPNPAASTHPGHGSSFLCCTPATQFAPAEPPSPTPERTGNPMRRGILLAFAAGSAASIAWLVLGAVAASHLAGRATEAPDRLRSILLRVVGDTARPPRLLIDAGIPHPVAVGLIRPAIVLPTRFADEEPDDRLAAAIAHEWAHIRNGDLRALAAARLLLPLLFAHPLYGWLRRRLRADQEALADAEAARPAGPIAYAEALLHWTRAESLGRGPSRAAASLGLWGRGSSLAGRVALLLDRDFRVETTCPNPWRWAVRGISAAMVLGLALASIRLADAGQVLASPRDASTAAANISRPHVHVNTIPIFATTAPDTLATLGCCSPE